MINSIDLLDALSIEAGKSVFSSIVNLNNLAVNAKGWLDVLASGDGTASCAVLFGTDNDDTFFTPSSVSNIFTGHTKSSGSSGRDLYQVDFDYLMPRLKFKFSETGGSNPIIITAKLIIYG